MRSHLQFHFKSHPHSYSCHSHAFKSKSRPHLSLRCGLRRTLPSLFPWCRCQLGSAVHLQEGEFLRLLQSGRGASQPRPLTAPCWRVRAARPHPLPGWPVWDPSCHITRELLHFLDSTLLDGIGLLSAFPHQSIDIKVFYFFPSLLLSPLYQIHIFCLLTTSWGESKLFSQFSLLKLVWTSLKFQSRVHFKALHPPPSVRLVAEGTEHMYVAGEGVCFTHSTSLPPRFHLFWGSWIEEQKEKAGGGAEGSSLPWPQRPTPCCWPWQHLWPSPSGPQDLKTMCQVSKCLQAQGWCSSQNPEVPPTAPWSSLKWGSSSISALLEPPLPASWPLLPGSPGQCIRKPA